MKLIETGLSPWEIEEKRNPRTKEGWRFYCPKQGNYFDCSGDVFPYLWALRAGYGICKSKWLWNNKKLFEKEGIKVEFKKLGKISKIGYTFGIFKQKIYQKFKRLTEK